MGGETRRREDGGKRSVEVEVVVVVITLGAGPWCNFGKGGPWIGGLALLAGALQAPVWCGLAQAAVEIVAGGNW